MNSLIDGDDLFVSSACEALRSGPAEAALKTLGWVDLLEELDRDDQARHAVFALFEAQGRQLAATSALARLMGHVYSSRLQSAGPVLAALSHPSSRVPDGAVMAAPLSEGMVVIDRPGLGASLIEAGRLRSRPLDLPGSPGLVLVDVNGNDLTDWLTETEAVPLREMAVRLGRIALSHEILGAAEAAVDLAIGYASDREQFGRPIGAFQAVRHLLAGASTDCAAVRAVAAQSASRYPDVSTLQASVAKALAGRNGRRACERSLQVLGGIGFTTEFDHHRYHSRVLALDALLGTSAFLLHQVTVALRSSEGAAEDVFPPAVPIPVN